MMNNKIPNFLTCIILLIGVTLSIVSQAEVAVIVNPANGDDLDAKTISKLFLAKSKSFPSAGKASVVEQKGGPTKNAFVKGVLRKSNKQYKAYWAKQVFTGKGLPPKELDGDAAVKAYVSGNVGAIGYIDAGKIDASVKVVFTL